MRDKLTVKQEKFVLDLFAGMTQRKAWEDAGYSTKYPIAIVDSNASRLANANKIQARFKELRQKAEDDAVATVIERRKRLTAIARIPALPFGVKPHDSILAIDLLNKMDKLYSDGAQVNIDNRSLTINVVSENARKLTELITEGKGTEIAISDH